MKVWSVQNRNTRFARWIAAETEERALSIALEKGFAKSLQTLRAIDISETMPELETGPMGGQAILDGDREGMLHIYGQSIQGNQLLDLVLGNIKLGRSEWRFDEGKAI